MILENILLVNLIADMDIKDLENKTFQPNLTLSELLRLEQALEHLKDLDELYRMVQTVLPEMLIEVLNSSTNPNKQPVEDMLEMLIDKVKVLSVAYNNPSLQAAYKKLRDELRTL